MSFDKIMHIDAAVLAESDIICTLGSGAFGRIYKARSKYTGEIVAIKQYLDADRDSQELISEEISILQHLQTNCSYHASFCQVVHEPIVGSESGIPYLIFEYNPTTFRR
jgi:serine/threonine protein kinase